MQCICNCEYACPGLQLDNRFTWQPVIRPRQEKNKSETIAYDSYRIWEKTVVTELTTSCSQSQVAPEEEEKEKPRIHSNSYTNSASLSFPNFVIIQVRSLFMCIYLETTV